MLLLIKWPVLLAWATSEPFKGCWAYFKCHWFKKVDANLHQFTLTKGGCTKIKLMQKAPSNGILHQLHQNYILLKFQNLISKTWNFLLRKMKFSIKNMKFSIKNMKFSIYEICQNSSFVLFVTEFSYHMYRKNAVLNGKQKQMKPLHMCVYLSQNWGSDGHFEVPNGSKSWFGQRLWPQM